MGSMKLRVCKEEGAWDLARWGGSRGVQIKGILERKS